MENMPPHRNLLNIAPMGRVRNIARGYIVTDNESGTSPLREKHKLNFLYNPSAISTGYGIDVSLDDINTGYGNDPRGSGNYVTVPNQRINFAIMFDRTYEVNEGTLANGVQHDIEVLKAIVGLKEDSYSQSLPANSDGVMMYSPVWFVFSNNTGALRLHGFIENFDITWELFSSQQVPMRCSVQISARLMPPTTQAPGESSSNSGSSGGGGGGGSRQQSQDLSGLMRRTERGMPHVLTQRIWTW